MEDRQIERLIALAERLRRLGDSAGAIDALRRALSLDPDHARAHAALAFTLLGARRLHGAAIEAQAALALDGGDPFCHLAAAAVRKAERKLDDAWAHCLVALEADSVDGYAFVLGARIQRLRNQPAAGRDLLVRALEQEPGDADAITELARLELGEGRLAEASARIDEALRLEPGDLEVHVVAGWIALRKGDVAGAEQHARFALSEDASRHDALELWTAIKARRSRLLGVWWRFNSFTSTGSEGRQIGIVIGSYVLARLAIIIAGATGHAQLEALLNWLWLGFCAYTWIAPVLFRRMLARDLEQVVLRKDF